MATLPLDISGLAGLATKYQGDLNSIVAEPNKRYLGKDGQFADGIFNPMRNYGYLSQPNNTFASVTGSMNARIIATEYDSINDDIYLAEAGNTIWKLDGLDDTTLTSAVVVNLGLSEVLTDLEIYEINGTRNLFYAYNITDGSEYFSRIGILGLDDDSGVYQISTLVPTNISTVQTITAGGTYQKLAQSVTPPTASSTITGSVTIVVGTTAVTGSETRFTTELEVGDTLGIASHSGGTEYYVVIASITDDTNLTITEIAPISTTDTAVTRYTGVTFNKIALPLLKTSADNGGYTLRASIEAATGVNSGARSLVTTANNSDFITDGAQTGLDLTGDFTIEGWFYMNAEPTNNVTMEMVSKFTSTSDERSYLIRYQNSAGTRQFQTKISSDGTAANTTTVTLNNTLAEDTWIHLAFLYDASAGTIEVYKNGVSIGTMAAHKTSIYDGTADFRIGYTTDDAEATLTLAPWNGYIDDLRVWSDLRTPTEITDNMSVELVGNETNLVAYWKYNNSRADYTANGNNLDTTGNIAYVTDVPFEPYGHPSGTPLAYADFNPSTVATSAFGITESNSTLYLELSATTYTTSIFWIVFGPTVFAQMTADDNVSWFGNITDIDTAGEAYRYDGTDWTKVDTSGDNTTDFDYALYLSEDQEWSYKRATGPIKMAYNADIFMCKADNGFMYIFEDNKVHRVDGSTTGGLSGSIQEQVLRFPTYFKCVDAVDTRGRMYIGVQSNTVSGYSDVRSYSEGQVGVYVWDRQSSVIGTRDFIPLPGVRDIKKLYVDASGDVRAICIGDDRFGQVRAISDGSGSVLKQLGLQGYPETRDSVKIVNNIAVWLGADAVIYEFGRSTFDSDEELYRIGTMASQPTGAFTTGAIFVGESYASASRQGILLAYEDTLGDSLKRWYPHGVGTINSVAQLGGQGDVYTLVKFLPNLSKINFIHLLMNHGSNSGSDIQGTVKLYLNQETTPTATYSITKDDILRGFKYLKVGKTNIFAFQLEFEWQTSEAMGADDFCPVLAQVDYEPTTKIL